MTAKSLHEAVAFDAPKLTPDGYGGQEVGWDSGLVICRANFKYLRGSEVVQAARLAGRQPVVVTIRTSRAAREITPDWRMRDTRQNVEYNIRTIVPTDDRMYLELTCESGVAV